MKKAIIFIFIFFKISAFGQIDPVFQSYYNDFLIDAQVRGVNLTQRYPVSIQFSKHELKSASAISYISHYNKTSNIKVDPIDWYDASDTKKKMMIYHELGHCLLFRPHCTHTLSLMNDPLISEDVFVNNEAAILEELFIPFSDPSIQLRYPLGHNDDTVLIKHGDLILLFYEFGDTLKPFIFNGRDKYSKLRFWMNNRHVGIYSIIDLTDQDKMVILNRRIVQINSTRAGISLIQMEIDKQPKWTYGGNIFFDTDDYLIFHFDKLNSHFDPTPFPDADIPSSYHTLSGQVKIDERITSIAKRIVVITLNKHPK
jgi:hypothetical protein